MRLQLPLKTPDLRLVSQDIIRARQELQPDRIEIQSLQPEHPLQRNRKIAATFAIFRRKPTAEEERHASRMVILLACSSCKIFSVLPDAAVRRHVRCSSEHLTLLSAVIAEIGV